jgi:hypothetical protein
MNHGESDSRRSSTSVRLSLPAPEHNGHSMVSVGNGDRVVMYPRGRGRGLTQVGRVSKFLGEMRVVLLLAPDQEIGVGGRPGLESDFGSRRPVELRESSSKDFSEYLSARPHFEREN